MTIRRREQDLILDFLEEFPDRFTSRRKKDRPDPGTPGGKREIRKIIATAQNKKILFRSPATVPDPAVNLILRGYYGIKKSKLEDINRTHQYSMIAENNIGKFLEDYITTTSRKNNCGWVRVFGDIIRAVDFIKRPSGRWRLLQVKNRDNSENSSSQSVRDGTSIEKWFRTFSRTGDTNWDAFPDENMRSFLNETSFQRYIADYLRGIRQ